MRGHWLITVLISLILGTSSARADPAWWEKIPPDQFLPTAQSLIREHRPKSEIENFKQGVFAALDEWMETDPASLAAHLLQKTRAPIATLYQALLVVSTPGETLGRMAYDLSGLKASVDDPQGRILWLQAWWDGFAEAALATGEAHPEVMRELLDGYLQLSRLDIPGTQAPLRSRALLVALCFVAESKTEEPGKRAELRAITDQLFPEWKMFTDQSRLSGRSLQSTAFLVAFVSQQSLLPAGILTRWRGALNPVDWGQPAPYQELLKNYKILLTAKEGFEHLPPEVQAGLLVEPDLYRDLHRHTPQGILISASPPEGLRQKLSPEFFAAWIEHERNRISASPELAIRLMQEQADLGLILGNRFWSVVKRNLQHDRFVVHLAHWLLKTATEPSALPPIIGSKDPFVGILETLYQAFATGYVLDSSVLMKWTQTLAPPSRFREFLDHFLVHGMVNERKVFQAGKSFFPKHGIISFLSSDWLSDMVDRVAHDGLPRGILDPELRFLNELFFESGLVFSQLNRKYDGVLRILQFEIFWEQLIYAFTRANPDFWSDHRTPEWQESVSRLLERMTLSVLAQKNMASRDRQERVSNLVESASSILHETLYLRFLKNIQPALNEKPLEELAQRVEKTIATIEKRQAKKIDTQAQCLELMLRFNPN